MSVNTKDTYLSENSIGFENIEENLGHMVTIMLSINDAKCEKAAANM